MTVRLNDIDVHHHESGTGPAVVFVHGLAEDHTTWQHQQRELVDHHTYAYDLRGHGATSLGAADGTLAQLRDDLIAFLAAVSGPATCVGFSLGGTVVLAAAAARPDLVPAAVVLGTSTVVGRAAAGAGIGAATARRLAADGFDVVITDAHERRCQALAEQLGTEHDRPFLAIPLDVTDAAAVADVVDAVIAQRGRLDVLVNNAGWSKIEPVAEMSLETWRRCLDVDLTGTFCTMRHALPHMIERGSGAIVNISSIAAWETSTEHGAAYSAAKAGVLALTRVAAAENGRHGIRVNAIAPGLIYNEFLRRIHPDSFFDGYAEHRSRLGRVGRPEDVAGLVSFLVGPDAGYVTGEVYGVSGGVFPHA